MNITRQQVQMLFDALAASATHDTEDGRKLLRYLERLLKATDNCGPRAVLFCDVSGVE